MTAHSILFAIAICSAMVLLAGQLSSKNET